jgi:hypothetical protein
MTFMGFFGKDPTEQITGVAAFVVCVCILIIFVIVVVSPLMGDKTSETTLSTEVIKVLVGLIGTAFGYLVGSMKSKSKDSND